MEEEREKKKAMKMTKTKKYYFHRCLFVDVKFALLTHLRFEHVLLYLLHP